MLPLWIIACLQFDVKREAKIIHLIFQIFSDNDKNYGNTAIWTILCFYPFPSFNNVEKQ